MNLSVGLVSRSATAVRESRVRSNAAAARTHSKLGISRGSGFDLRAIVLVR